MRRKGAELVVDVSSVTPTVLCVDAHETLTACAEQPAREHVVRLPLPAVEVNVVDEPVTRQGDRSQAMHVLEQKSEPHLMKLTLEAPAGSEHTLKVRYNVPAGAATPSVRANGAEMQGDVLKVRAPAGDGYQTMSVSLRW